VASRRGSEKIIRSGLVTVDGKVQAEPGALVDPRAQEIKVDDQPLPARPARRYIVLNKPTGVITSRNDPDGRRTVFALIPDDDPSIAAVGRLDYGTDGVLLLTNDGELGYRLTHPKYGVPKSYLAKISGTPDARKMSRLIQGVQLEDGPSGPCLAEIVRTTGPSTWVLLTTRGGRNRIVRRMFEAIGHRVLKLKRVGFGGITLRGLAVGDTREITRGELEHLRRMVGASGRSKLFISREVRVSVAELLRIPLPAQEPVRSRDDEGRPYRKKGWARPKAKKSKHGRRKDRDEEGGPRNPRRGRR
jgi:pseudouridine synthase